MPSPTPPELAPLVRASFEHEEATDFLGAARACREALELALEATTTAALLLRGALLLLAASDGAASPAETERLRGIAHSMLKRLQSKHAGDDVAIAGADLLARSERGEEPALDTGELANRRLRKYLEGAASPTLAAAREIEAQLAQQPLRARPDGSPVPVEAQASRLPRRVYWISGLVFALAWLLGWSLAGRFRSVDEIDPLVLEEPVQSAIENPQAVTLERAGHRVTLTPLADYALAALVVSRNDYNRFGLFRSDRVIPTDLCVIWGANAGRGRHRESDVKFRQSGRFCLAEWQDTNVNPKQLSNNHLIVADDAVDDLLAEVEVGDQILLEGQLVDVDAELMAGFTGLEASEFRAQSSRSRTDKGAGACEIIYVQKIRILRRGNVAARTIRDLAFWAFALWACAGGVWLGVQRLRRKVKGGAHPAEPGAAPYA